MAELTPRELAEYEVADVIGHLLLNPDDKATRLTLAHLLQDNLGGDLSAWLKSIDDLAGTKEVVVTVSGGVVQDVEVPPGVNVEVRDYDNAEGVDEGDLDKGGSIKDASHPAAYGGWQFGVDDDGYTYQIARY